MKIEACCILEMVRAVKQMMIIPIKFSESLCYISQLACFFFYCRRMPSLLEYLSYNCNFMGILAGPLCSYKDYITFIEGRSYHMTQSGGNGKEEILYERTEPSPNVRSCDLSGAFIACID